MSAVPARVPNYHAGGVRLSQFENLYFGYCGAVGRAPGYWASPHLTNRDSHISVTVIVASRRCRWAVLLLGRSARQTRSPTLLALPVRPLKCGAG